MDKKNSFIMYTDYMAQINLLSMEQRGVLLTAVMNYHLGEKLPNMDGIVQMAFSFMEAQFKRDGLKYEEVVKKRKEAGKQGGRPKKEQEEKANGFSKKAKKANGFSEKQTKAKKADNVNDNDNVNVNDNDDDDVIISSCVSNASASNASASRKNNVIVSQFLLKDGTMYDVTEEDVSILREAYPEVDMEVTLARVKSWCYSNPEERKTRSGAKKFLNNWFNREKDKIKSNAVMAANYGKVGYKQDKQTNRFHNFEQRDYDFDAIEKRLENNAISQFFSAKK